MLIYWTILREWLSSKELVIAEVLDLRLSLTIALFLGVPILVGDLSFMTPCSRVIYAATSIVVALKEEITFRAFIQSLLARRFGHLKAILGSTVLFIGYHVGAIPLLLFAYGQVVAASLLFGILYARTQNLWLVICLHAAYDALWSLTPIGTGQFFPYSFGLLVLMASLFLVIMWGRSAHLFEPEG